MYHPGYDTTVPPMVSVFVRGIGWADEATVTSFPVSGNFSSANQAVYFPLVLPATCVVRRVWWYNGATTTGGATIEVGVYANSGYGPGSKLVSGSATQGTASTVQFADVTDTTLPPGLHWIAIMSSSTTNTTIMRSLLASTYNAAYRFEEASANPLPSSATPVASTALVVYACGFATIASP